MKSKNARTQSDSDDITYIIIALEQMFYYITEVEKVHNQLSNFHLTRLFLYDKNSISHKYKYIDFIHDKMI